METWGVVASLVIATTAVFLLMQGQVDRRRDRLYTQRDQARKVSITVIEHGEYGDHSFSLTSRTVRLRNDSDLPVSYDGHIELRTRPEIRCDHNSMVGNGKVLDTHETTLRPHEEGAFSDTDHLWDQAVFCFTDADGQHWARVSETGRLYSDTFRSTRRSRIYQAASRLPLSEQLLITWPNGYAHWRTAQTGKIPLTARWIRFWWGSMPATEEPKPWDRPYDYKRSDWPYENFLSFVRWHKQFDRETDHGKRSPLNRG